MEVQSELPPELSYFLDCALENDDLNSFGHATLSLYADRRAVEDVHSRLQQRRRDPVAPWSVKIAPFFLELDALAHAAAARLSELEQRMLFAAAIVREVPRLHSLAECHAGWNYEDSTIGGALTKFRRQKSRVTKTGLPAGQVAWRLRQHRCVERYVGRVDCQSTRHAEVLARGLRRLPWPEHVSEADALQDFFAAQRQRYLAEHRRQANIFIREAASSRRQIRDHKPARRRAAKSAVQVRNTIGQNATAALLRGESALVVGQELNFRVQVPRATDVGMQAVQVRLEDQQGGDLAGLCVYFDDTPALEQVAALALNAQAGCESEVLAAANVLDVTTLGASHPALAERLRQRRDATDELERIIDRLRGTPSVRRAVREDYQRELKAQYVAEMTPAYLLPLIDRVWGEDASRLRKLAWQVPSQRELMQRAA